MTFPMSTTRSMFSNATVDYEGEVLEILVTKTRDKKAAPKRLGNECGNAVSSCSPQPTCLGPPVPC